jgi:DNA-binding FadR family transcriptional regulator
LDFEFNQDPASALRIHQELADQLGKAILSGKLEPGQGLPRELESGNRLNVSRSSYREAVRTLIAKGLVESRPKAGTRVTPRDRWHLLDPDILAWMFSGEPNQRFVRDLFELRGVIEPAAAEMAAARRSSEQLSAMEQSLDDMRLHGLSTDEGRQADRQFHRHILEATGNEAIKSLAGSVGAAVQWTTQFKQRLRRRPRDPYPEHKALFDAISQQSVTEARIAMQELLRLALSDMGLDLSAG